MESHLVYRRYNTSRGLLPYPVQQVSRQQLLATTGVCTERSPRAACPCGGLVSLRGLHCLRINFPFKAIPKAGLSKVSKGESFGLRSQLAYLGF